MSNPNPSEKKGICCVCQSVAPVRQRLYDDGDTIICVGYLVDSHKFLESNLECEGEGTVPQCLIN